jgi:hypothetical protein
MNSAANRSGSSMNGQWPEPSRIWATTSRKNAYSYGASRGERSPQHGHPASVGHDQIGNAVAVHVGYRYGFTRL